MILDYDLTSPSNQTLSTGSWNWTALMTSDTHWVNHSNLSEYGNYYLNVTLSYINEWIADPTRQLSSVDLG